MLSSDKISEAVTVRSGDHLSPHQIVGGDRSMADNSLHARMPRGTNKGCAASCHPERNAYCKGLCQSCYVRHRLKLKTRKADCHPDRPHSAHGLCRMCDRDRRRKLYPHESKSKAWRRAHLKYTFGISEQDYDDLLAKQDGKCGMCGARESTGRWKRLSVDHDHKTNHIRGLLCFRCNVALGVYERTAGMCEAWLHRHRQAVA